MDRDTSQAPEIEALEALLSCLHDEQEAVTSLDVAGIERAAQRKEALDHRLEALSSTRTASGASMSTPDRDRCLALLDAIAPLAEQNNRNLQTAHRTVRGLINAMTGADQRAYGRKGSPVPTSSAVLTSSVG